MFPSSLSKAGLGNPSYNYPSNTTGISLKSQDQIEIFVTQVALLRGTSLDSECVIKRTFRGGQCSEFKLYIEMGKQATVNSLLYF